ncbi:MAG: DcrB-related protein [Myxococcota bacterium]
MVSPLAKLHFSAPTDWLDVSVLAFTAGGGEGYAENIVASCEPLNGHNLVAFASEAIEDLKAMTADYRSIRREAASYAGIKGELVEHSFVEDGVALCQVQFFFAVDDDGFTLAVTYPADQVDVLHKTFEKVAASLSTSSA